MCEVHNLVGSLTAIKSHLHYNNVNDLNSINELIAFQKNYSLSQEKIISKHQGLISDERDSLSGEISALEKNIEINRRDIEQKLQLELSQLRQQLDKSYLIQLNYIKKFAEYIKRFIIRLRIRNIEDTFELRVSDSVKELTDELSTKNSRYAFIISQFQDAVDQSSSRELNDLKRRKNVIDEINTLIYGTIGEQKVSNELEKLSDDYILINDFTCSFSPPIYNKKKNEYIGSVQIDHILVSPAGVFLIETKNWSENSLNNLNLRSPVEQINRANNVLFRILNEGFANNSLKRHHWGDRKITIRNLIVLINKKPNEEFNYVKILTLRELRSYVEYFKPSLSIMETRAIANYLLRINRQTINNNR